MEEVGGANNSALVLVYVDNKNDVSPVFEPAFYNASIVEGADEGAFIQQVHVVADMHIEPSHIELCCRYWPVMETGESLGR